MPDLLQKTTRASFPKGHPWTLSGLFGQLIDGVAKTFTRVRDLAFLAIRESRPGSSETQNENWYSEFNVTYDSSLPLAERQARISQIYTAIGGQNLDYIQAEVAKVFPDIIIEEYLVQAGLFMTGIGMTGQMMTSNYPSWIPAEYQDGTYPVWLCRVRGTVDSVDDLRRLGDILQKTAPGTHIPVFDDDVLDAPATSMAGLAKMGLAKSGRIE